MIRVCGEALLVVAILEHLGAGVGAQHVPEQGDEDHNEEQVHTYYDDAQEDLHGFVPL